MKILLLTAHFRPNIGGVETHLDDLVNVLLKRNWPVVVLTYRPLTTQAKWKIYESYHGISIIRIPWIPNLFYKLVSFPILEFFYLFPGLFLVAPFVLLFKDIDIIHAQGLVSGFVGVFWGKIFGKKVIVSAHSIYNFPKKGFYTNFVRGIFNNASYSMGLSKQAASEIKSLGINKDKVRVFTYWIDLEKFKKVVNAKIKLGWRDKFVVLFVGRLVKEKGIIGLLESAKKWDKRISLKVIGSGPLVERVKEVALKCKNIEYVGIINQDNLPMYYSGSDILIVPSTSEEGFGRVILEALSCGTPVIGSKRGAIPDAMDETVGRLIEVNPENIKLEVEYFYNHRVKLKQLSENARIFAERRYSEKNAETIIKAYQK